MSFMKEHKNKDMNEIHSMLQLLTCQDCCFHFDETSDFRLTIFINYPRDNIVSTYLFE